ncbi:DUF1622 domain-containing protein [Roseateles sp.]|uniref:DUF1622 domain-containing protein n=1 Tax=Roseateles sp. TaxID=1971397 RepID=UPI0039C93F42
MAINVWTNVYLRPGGTPVRPAIARDLTLSLSYWWGADILPSFIARAWGRIGKLAAESVVRAVLLSQSEDAVVAGERAAVDLLSGAASRSGGS